MATRAVLLLLLLLSALPARAGDGFRLPHSFEVDGISLRVVGAEVTPDKRNFLVHVEAEESAGREEAQIHWQSWFAALTVEGTRLTPTTDVGVDDGSGLRRCFGSVRIKKGQRLRLMMYWPVYQHELPIRLWCRDGRTSEEGFR